MESIISTFHIDWKIIIAQAINFGVVFTVLYIFALKPLSKLMNERGEKIAKGIDDAKTNAVILEKSKNEYEQMLMNTRAEADAIFKAGKKEAETERARILESTKEEVAGIISQGKKTLEADKAKMVNEAKSEITSLAMQIVEKLVSEKSVKELENL